MKHITAEMLQWLVSASLSAARYAIRRPCRSILADCKPLTKRYHTAMMSVVAIHLPV